MITLNDDALNAAHERLAAHRLDLLEAAEDVRPEKLPALREEHAATSRLMAELERWYLVDEDDREVAFAVEQGLASQDLIDFLEETIA